MNTVAFTLVFGQRLGGVVSEHRLLAKWTGTAPAVVDDHFGPSCSLI